MARQMPSGVLKQPFRFSHHLLPLPRPKIQMQICQIFSFYLHGNSGYKWLGKCQPATSSNCFASLTTSSTFLPSSGLSSKGFTLKWNLELKIKNWKVSPPADGWPPCGKSPCGCWQCSSVFPHPLASWGGPQETLPSTWLRQKSWRSCMRAPR